MFMRSPFLYSRMVVATCQAGGVYDSSHIMLNRMSRAILYAIGRYLRHSVGSVSFPGDLFVFCGCRPLSRECSVNFASVGAGHSFAVRL